MQDVQQNTKADSLKSVLCKLDISKHYLFVSPVFIKKMLRYIFHTFMYLSGATDSNKRMLFRSFFDVQKHNLWLFAFVISFFVCL